MPRPAAFVAPLLAVLMTVAAVSAAAQDAPKQMIYKVRMPDGRILFTDSVPAGAKILESREAGKPQQLTIPPPAAPRASAPPSVREPSPIDKAMTEVEAAERALAEARAALEAGSGPREGDRVGLRGGGTRLSPEYEERVRLLQARVAEAEERVRKAYQARNAAR